MHAWLTEISGRRLANAGTWRIFLDGVSLCVAQLASKTGLTPKIGVFSLLAARPRQFSSAAHSATPPLAPPSFMHRNRNTTNLGVPVCNQSYAVLSVRQTVALYLLLFLCVALRLRNGNPVSPESAPFSMHLSPASSFPTVPEPLWVIRGLGAWG